MAKITISRIFETSKALATKAGAELEDTITFIADLAEETLRNLRNGLTFTDNFDCTVKTVSLTNNVETGVNVGTKTPTGIIPTRVISTTSGLDSFIWYIATDGTLRVKATFTGSPTAALQVVLVILFG